MLDNATIVIPYADDAIARVKELAAHKDHPIFLIATLIDEKPSFNWVCTICDNPEDDMHYEGG